MMDAEPSNLVEDDIAVTLKILVQEQEVREIAGKNDSTIRVIRSQTGAGVSISEGPHTDRIIAITGSLEEVYNACRLVIERIEPYDEGNDRSQSNDSYYIKIIIPAAHCGPLIGKGGSKIKEIRDNTGASVQVAADILPDSSERIVNLTGTIDAICDCMYEICIILITTPQKFGAISYDPNYDTIEGPLVFANGKVYTVQGTVAVPIADLGFLFKTNLASAFFGNSCYVDYSMLSKLAKDNANYKDSDKKHFHLQEIQVPDDVVNGSIGRNGIKLTDIRRITGARVILSDDDVISEDSRERTVTIKGPKEAVTLARYLINACIDLQKLSFDPQKDEQFECEQESALSTLIGLLGRPGAINILSNITGYSTVPEFISSFNPNKKKE